MLLVCAVLVRWFEERCLACRRPLTPALILASSCPSIYLSIYPSLLKTGPFSDCVNKSRVPLKASCCCNFLRCLVIFRIRAGRWVGWRTIIILRVVSLFFFFFFSISDCKERILVAGLNTDLVRGTKTVSAAGCSESCCPVIRCRQTCWELWRLAWSMLSGGLP